MLTEIFDRISRKKLIYSNNCDIIKHDEDKIYVDNVNKGHFDEIIELTQQMGDDESCFARYADLVEATKSKKHCKCSAFLILVSHDLNMLNTLVAPKESVCAFVRSYGGGRYPMRRPHSSNRFEVKPNESRVIAVGGVVAVPHVRIIADQ